VQSHGPVVAVVARSTVAQLVLVVLAVAVLAVL